ncbi:hypothetical protein [Prevotella melaninogenica]|uniref:hypothetical protein n=1 Tax=Prevotella melaninogenica TaxID=28132 RepID=UPI0028EE2E7D|nr:hypothetical protein [Prevotella melaninogenica]
MATKLSPPLQQTSFTNFAQAVDSIAKAQMKNIWCASLTAYENSRATLFRLTAPMPFLPT